MPTPWATPAIISTNGTTGGTSFFRKHGLLPLELRPNPLYESCMGHTLYYMHVRTRAAIMRVARRALVSVVLYAYVILQQAISHVFMMLFGNKTVLTYRHARNAPHRAPTSYRSHTRHIEDPNKRGLEQLESPTIA